jgi:hypothetical protein
MLHFNAHNAPKTVKHWLLKCALAPSVAKAIDYAIKLLDNSHDALLLVAPPLAPLFMSRIVQHRSPFLASD